MGKLIVIEGACDGIGKSTQYAKLCEHLESDGQVVIKHHFPSYNTQQGLPVEKYLRGEFGKPSELSPYFVNNLYANDRDVTWRTELQKPYNEGKMLVLDRYTPSSIMYQSAYMGSEEEKRKFANYVMDYEYNVLRIARPNMVIFLYAPFELVTKLRNARTQNDGVTKDIHETDIEFMKRVYDSGMWYARNLGWQMVKCNNGDEMRSIEDIHREIYSRVVRTLHLKK